MRRMLQYGSLVLFLGAVLTWLLLGANRGWTRTSEAIEVTDDVTGLTGVEYRKRFMPGLDFLGGALLTAGVAAAASLLIKKSKNNLITQTIERK